MTYKKQSISEIWLNWFPEMKIQLAPIFDTREINELYEDIRRKKGL